MAGGGGPGLRQGARADGDDPVHHPVNQGSRRRPLRRGHLRSPPRVQHGPQRDGAEAAQPRSVSRSEEKAGQEERGPSDLLDFVLSVTVLDVNVEHVITRNICARIVKLIGSFTSGSDGDQVPASICEQPEQDPVQQNEEEDLVLQMMKLMSNQDLHSTSPSTAEISSPPSEDSEDDRLNGQVENDDGLGLVQSDTPIGAAAMAAAFIIFGTFFREYFTVATYKCSLSLPDQGYPSENPEADNTLQVFRMPESNIHSQVLPSTSEEVALFAICLVQST
ncbi:hypothetical protein PR202_ga17824 [Eleusine coracana subsp. coracana]|uniref:Uncharacterized protein n=1 Tax=Eleusine coracana subsp. coracana TaxID=191504 RepID=A0AAV5CQ54_ELECO|nr:hypothetical protein PR202_ga17824 [Eleusine coracana subsp. coracana]